MSSQKKPEPAKTRTQLPITKIAPPKMDQLCDCIRAPFKELSHARTISIIALSDLPVIELCGVVIGN